MSANKILGEKRFPKNFGSKIFDLNIFGENNFGSKNILCKKKFELRKYIKSKKILGSKIVWLKKNFDQTFFGVKLKFAVIIFFADDTFFE